MAIIASAPETYDSDSESWFVRSSRRLGHGFGAAMIGGFVSGISVGMLSYGQMAGVAFVGGFCVGMITGLTGKRTPLQLIVQSALYALVLGPMLGLALFAAAVSIGGVGP